MNSQTFKVTHTIEYELTAHRTTDGGGSTLEFRIGDIFVVKARIVNLIGESGVKEVYKITRFGNEYFYEDTHSLMGSIQKFLMESLEIPCKTTSINLERVKE